MGKQGFHDEDADKITTRMRFAGQGHIAIIRGKQYSIDLITDEEGCPVEALIAKQMVHIAVEENLFSGHHSHSSKLGEHNAAQASGDALARSAGIRLLTEYFPPFVANAPAGGPRCRSEG